MRAVAAQHALLGAGAALVAALMVSCASASPADLRTAAGRDVQGGAWFSQTGCTECHTLSVYGLWNPAANAPDLSIAVEDVPKRFGRSLEDFLNSPIGTMSLVLSDRIPLNEQGRALAIDRLKEAYRHYQETTGRPMRSH